MTSFFVFPASSSAALLISTMESLRSNTIYPSLIDSITFSLAIGIILRNSCCMTPQKRIKPVTINIKGVGSRKAKGPTFAI